MSPFSLGQVLDVPLNTSRPTNYATLGLFDAHRLPCGIPPEAYSKKRGKPSGPALPAMGDWSTAIARENQASVLLLNLSLS